MSCECFFTNDGQKHSIMCVQACRFYALHLSQTCVVLAGAPLRDSSLAEGAVLAREWLPAADQYVRFGAGAERQHHQAADTVASTMVAQVVRASTSARKASTESAPSILAPSLDSEPTPQPALVALLAATAAHDQLQMQRRRILGPSPSAALAHTQHSHVLILTRDISAPSDSSSSSASAAASIQVDSAAAFERALGHAHARAQRIARWWRHRLGVRLVVCASSALSDATLFACAANGIACAHGVDRVELAVLQRTVGAHITAPENAVVAFLEDEEWARIIDERAVGNAGDALISKSAPPMAPDQATHGAPLSLPFSNQAAADKLRRRLGVGSARLIEALSLGAGRPAIRIVGIDRANPASASGMAPAASACVSSRLRLHSLLLRAPHAVVGAQYQETVGRSLRLLADWFVNDAHEGMGGTVSPSDSFAWRVVEERTAGVDASSRHADLTASVAAAAAASPSLPVLASSPALSSPSSLPSSMSPVSSPPSASFFCAPMSSVGGAGAFELAMHAACDRRRRALSGARRGGGGNCGASAVADPSGTIGTLSQRLPTLCTRIRAIFSHHVPISMTFSHSSFA